MRKIIWSDFQEFVRGFGFFMTDIMENRKISKNLHENAKKQLYKGHTLCYSMGNKNAIFGKTIER